MATSDSRASNRSERLRDEARPVLRPRDQRLQLRQHLAAVAHAQGEGVGAGEEAGEGLARPRRQQDGLGPAAARAQHIAVGETAAGDQPAQVPVRRSTRPSSTSLMCTSTASKPARSKAAAISIWPFTPCSRRMATRGRAPRARTERTAPPDPAGAVAGIERHDHGVQATVGRVDADVLLLGGAAGVVPQRLHAEGRVRPDAPQPAARGLELDAGRAARCGCRSLGGQPGDRVDGPGQAGGGERLAHHRLVLRGAPPPPRPISSANSSASGSGTSIGWRRSADRSMSSPTPPANAISSRVTSRPPSERSW